MASVQITFPEPSLIFSSAVGWTPAFRPALGVALSADGATPLYFAHLDLHRTSPFIGRITLYLASVATGGPAPATAGPEFSDQMEQSGRITFTASNGESVTVSGISDATEPYQWIPANSSAVAGLAETIATLVDKSLTITFDDGADAFPLKARERVGGLWASRNVHTTREKVAGAWVEAGRPHGLRQGKRRMGGTVTS